MVGTDPLPRTLVSGLAARRRAVRGNLGHHASRTCCSCRATLPRDNAERHGVSEGMASQCCF